MTFNLNPAALEAVAQADAALNNACVPTYTQVVTALISLTQQADLTDLKKARNRSLQRAKDLLGTFLAAEEKTGPRDDTDRHHEKRGTTAGSVRAALWLSGLT